jgi:hypothetical protein
VLIAENRAVENRLLSITSFSFVLLITNYIQQSPSKGANKTSIDHEMYFHFMLLSIHENRRREGRAFLMGINEIIFPRVS